MAHNRRLKAKRQRRKKEAKRKKREQTEMAAREFDTRRKHPNVPGQKTRGSGPKGTINMKVPAFAKVPGGTGPNRSAGVPKVKQHPQSQGL